MSPARPLTALACIAAIQLALVAMLGGRPWAALGLAALPVAIRRPR